ncbi:hypothetical protein [Flexivirga caeni]|uniref:Uncharacterized protein n=1 Tax=Flexivirga caeni TaxID=2294115 RepID=A0A3M9LWG7_9MICO|nr:hypothetical protein [Flexivirga caeni]RNI16923.1 hypothetical protein EFY87_19795 [Flexivirga caeni]
MWVDPADDSIDRFVVLHYRYDADRNERRKIVTWAFDNSRERDAEIFRIAHEIEAGKASGEADRAEYLSGSHWPVNYFRNARRSRIRFNALKRGVIIPDAVLREL